jgi:hypothetical protein
MALDRSDLRLTASLALVAADADPMPRQLIARIRPIPSAITSFRRYCADRGPPGVMSVLRVSSCAMGVVGNPQLGGTAIAVDRDVHVIHMISGR